MYEDANTLLESTRADRRTWFEFGYDEVVDDSDPRGVWDENDIRRESLLRAIQADLDVERDHELVRYLFDAEVEKHERSRTEEMDDSLALAAFLLAAFRSVDDVWRMAKAKFANPGTAARFEPEHLIAAGMTETLDYVRATEHALQRQLLYYFFDEDDYCHLARKHVDSWWAHKCTAFQYAS